MAGERVHGVALPRSPTGSMLGANPIVIPTSTTTTTSLSSNSMTGVGPRNYRFPQDIYDTTTSIDLEDEVGLCLLRAEEPISYEEAKKHVSWRGAMEAELEAIYQNSTWEMANLPDGHKPIGLKWVFKIKKDSKGVVVKHKARLVAKGYVQRKGVDFDEVSHL